MRVWETRDVTLFFTKDIDFVTRTDEKKGNVPSFPDKDIDFVTRTEEKKGNVPSFASLVSQTSSD